MKNLSNRFIYLIGVLSVSILFLLFSAIQRFLISNNPNELMWYIVPPLAGVFIGVLLAMGYIRNRNLLIRLKHHKVELEKTVFERTEELEVKNRKLKRQASLDGLTGIPNFRNFEIILEREVNRRNRTGKPLSLIMCDIDYFKHYNDTYGHVKGDECLRAVARCILFALKRPGDYVARYGGEEFVIVLPETDLEGGIHIASDVRHALVEANIEHAASSVSKFVTISLGVACMHDVNELKSGEDLIKEADKMLYLAKNKGRNQVQPVNG